MYELCWKSVERDTESQLEKWREIRRREKTRKKNVYRDAGILSFATTSNRRFHECFTDRCSRTIHSATG